MSPCLARMSCHTPFSRSAAQTQHLSAGKRYAGVSRTEPPRRSMKAVRFAGDLAPASRRQGTRPLQGICNRRSELSVASCPTTQKISRGFEQLAREVARVQGQPVGKNRKTAKPATNLRPSQHGCCLDGDITDVSRRKTEETLSSEEL